MAIKAGFILLALTALTQVAWGARDLAADIETAKNKVGFFDVIVAEMTERTNILQLELGLPIDDLTSNIIENLNLIATPSAINVVQHYFTLFREEFDTNSVEFKRILVARLPFTLSNVHDNLDNALNLVPANTAVLKREIGDADVAYGTMWDSIVLLTTDADQAIFDAVNGQVGQTVTDIYTDWQQVLDILENEQFLTTDVKIVFDGRGKEATDALDAVVLQIPQA